MKENEERRTDIREDGKEGRKEGKNVHPDVGNHRGRLGFVENVERVLQRPRVAA
jgi:hypothetical protein